MRRNLDKEQRFREFMADNQNIRDVDEVLIKFNACAIKNLKREKAVGMRSIPPDGAVKMLRSDPQMATYFDEKYGKGSAENYLNLNYSLILLI